MKFLHGMRSKLEGFNEHQLYSMPPQCYVLSFALLEESWLMEMGAHERAVVAAAIASGAFVALQDYIDAQ